MTPTTAPAVSFTLSVQKEKAKGWLLTEKEQAVISVDISCYLKLSHNLITPCSSGTSIGPSAQETYCLLFVAKKKLGRAAQLVWQPACPLGFACITENLFFYSLPSVLLDSMLH